jgi:hypothetical protein
MPKKLKNSEKEIQEELEEEFDEELDEEFPVEEVQLKPNDGEWEWEYDDGYDEDDDDEEDDYVDNSKEEKLKNYQYKKILISIMRSFSKEIDIQNIKRIFASKVQNNSYFSIQYKNEKIDVSEVLMITLSNKTQYIYLEKENLAFPLNSVSVNLIEFKNKGKFDFSKMKTENGNERIIL